MVALAIAGGILGYLYLKHQSRQRRMEIIHEERMAAMEKGIPLPELPLDLEQRSQSPDPNHIIPILGTVLTTLSTGAMIALYWNLDGGPSQEMWLSPLPLLFLGIGLIVFHFLKAAPRP